jgi:N-carbamoylputrescine amidase
MTQKQLKIGIVQQHNTADAADNRRRLTAKIRQLSAGGCRLVVLQELHESLYFCQTENVDLFDLAHAVPGPDTDYYSRVAREAGVVLVTSLFERRAPGLYHNTAVVFDSDGTMAGRYRKMHIPDDPAYYEKFYFTPGDLGFHPIRTSVGCLGVLVCWDQWYPEAARLMALRGADILIYPTAIGYESSDTPEEQQRQREAWQIVQRGHAVANGLPLVSVNRVGFEPDPSGQTRGIEFWGSSFVAGPQGELLLQAPSDAEYTGAAVVDMARSEQVRRWWPFLRDRRIDQYGDIAKRFLDEV